MLHRSLFVSLVLGLPVASIVTGCASLPGFSSSKDDGLARVDQLLTAVERVQAESVLARERADVALGTLRELVAPEFDGDPLAAHARLVKEIAEARKQTEKLELALPPLEDTARKVFLAWTEESETIGSTRLRRQSQARMAATRQRYEAVQRSATEVQIACEAFNSNLEDHATFLEHDFNAESVAALAEEVALLDEQSEELAQRVEACVDASKLYVETAALRGQLAQTGTAARPVTQRAQETTPAKRRAKQPATAKLAEEPADAPAAETKPVAQKVD
ncbi:MAG: DUF2959 family protein [Planctomycetaceae bacterium]|nr:DUF2959 family protein [Planctomycetaceae bacterium]